MGALTLSSTLLLLPTPLLTSMIIDRCLPDHDLDLLVLILATILGLQLVQCSVSYWLSIYNTQVSEEIVLQVKQRLLEKVIHAPMNKTWSMGSGYLMSRIDHDGDQVRFLMAETLFSTLRSFLVFLTGGIALFWISWKLAMITIMILPVYAMITIYYGKRVKKDSDTNNEEYAQTTNRLQEALDGAQTCKALSTESFAEERYAKRAIRSMAAYLKLNKTQTVAGALIALVSGFAPVVILGQGALEIMEGRLSLGKLVAFTQFISYLFEPTRMFVNLNISFAQARSAVARLDQILELPEEHCLQRQQSISRIGMEHLFVTIGEHKLLTDVSVFGRRGEIVGIVGASGAGKTTLGRVLTGLITADRGQVRINEQRAVGPEAFLCYRQNCAVVEQEPFFFDATVAENVALESNIHQNRVRKSLAGSQALGFTEELELGLGTPLGKRGNRLSVGQKQRLAIARALYREADIIVFDEPTANLDLDATNLLLAVIRKLAQDRIIFLISHQEHVIQHCCHRLITLKAGRGTPN